MVGNFGEQVHRFRLHRCIGKIGRLRIVAAHHRYGRAQHVHRVRLARRHHHVGDVLRNGAQRTFFFVERVELSLRRQFAAQQKVGDFLEPAMRRQILYRIAAIGQRIGFLDHFGNRRLVGDDARKAVFDVAFVDRASHARPMSAWRVRPSIRARSSCSRRRCP